MFYEGLTHRLARRYLFNSLFGVGDPCVHVEFFPGLVIRISYIELFINPVSVWAGVVHEVESGCNRAIFCPRKRVECGCRPGVKERQVHYGYRYQFCMMHTLAWYRVTMRVHRRAQEGTSRLTSCVGRSSDSVVDHKCQGYEMATMMDCAMFPCCHLLICLY